MYRVFTATVRTVAIIFLLPINYRGPDRTIYIHTYYTNLLPSPRLDGFFHLPKLNYLTAPNKKTDYRPSSLRENGAIQIWERGAMRRTREPFEKMDLILHSRLLD